MPYLTFILVYIGEAAALALLGERTYAAALDASFLHAFLAALAVMAVRGLADFITAERGDKSPLTEL